MNNVTRIKLNIYVAKKKKKKNELSRAFPDEDQKRKTIFFMDNVINLFRRKRINQQSMYGNFQYEKIV